MFAKPLTAAIVTGTLLLAGATPALADKGANDRGKRASGSCATGVWNLKAKPDDGRLEVEFEIDTNRNGQAWRVRIFDNGHRVFAGTRTTHAPSGSFDVEKRIANRAGRDHIVAKATRVSTGRTCTGSLTF
jgi:hypothetical protein